VKLPTILDVILEFQKQVGQGGLDERCIANSVVERCVPRLEQAEGARPESKPFFLGCDAPFRWNSRVLIVRPLRLDEPVKGASHGTAEGLEFLLW